MGLRKVSVVIGTVLLCLPTVLGQLRICTAQERCIPIGECPAFQKYVGIRYTTWPENVINDVKARYCGMEQGGSKKIHQICCSTSGGIEDHQSTPNTKRGRELLDLKECGKNDKTRIAHGGVAEVFEFPWMALLRGFDGTFHCGGSLIADRYVLTAAHCGSRQVLSVRLGETDISQDVDCVQYPGGEEDCAEPPQDIPVDKFIKNEYSSSRKKNDIALVRLQWAAERSDSVRPICLPLPELEIKTLPKKMVISGWGYTELANETSDQLRYAYVPIIDLTECNEAIRKLQNDLSVDQSQVCAIEAKNNSSTCNGDSGGPLHYFGKTGFVLHGVVSYGTASCDSETVPRVYTKVLHYLDWIIDNLI